MSHENQNSTSGPLSRRSVLAALGGSAAGGLAGCSGNGGTSGGGEATASKPDCDEGKLADMPGEVVRNRVDSLDVLSHSVCDLTPGFTLQVRVKNTGDNALVPEQGSGSLKENPVFVTARALSSEGDPLIIESAEGPNEIKPGTEATLNLRLTVEMARYELCINAQGIVSGNDWQNICGG